jgi:hypothetical protein
MPKWLDITFFFYAGHELETAGHPSGQRFSP